MVHAGTACEVSIILTAYNQNSLLVTVLGCLAAQDFEGAWEVIVCDDGSEQDTLSVVSGMPESIRSKIRYIWQSRNGERRAHTRNNGLRCARGRIIILMDGDIAVRSDFISKHVAAHDGGLTLVCGTRKWLFLRDLPADTPLGEIVEMLLAEGVDTSALHSDLRFQERCMVSPYPWLACMGFNLSFVRCEDNVFFDENFIGWGCEDQEFACRLCVRYGYSLKFSRTIDTVHLDDSSRRDFLAVKPRRHSEINFFARNLLYFCEQYPEFDSTLICHALGLYELNEATGLWSRAHRPRFDREHIRNLLLLAKRCV
jgi:glycosyltransferase involved in cell wall biosynthesis